MLNSNIDYPVDLYGGRTGLMEVLEKLTHKQEIPVVKYAGITYSEVEEIIDHVFCKPIQYIDFNNDFTESRIVEINELIMKKGESLINSNGVPALKTSYLANNNPELYSFAGVGCTAIPRAKQFPLGKCLQKIIVETQKEYSKYYRRVHKDIDNLKFGCMFMENLPKQFAWGTVWSGKNGCVFEVFTSYAPIIVKHVLVKKKDELLLCIPESISDKYQFQLKLQRLYDWSRTIPFSDIEFCIGQQGLLVTQYRPIPYSLVPKISFLIDNCLEGDCPPPYADNISTNGRVRIFTEKANLQLMINKEYTDNEIWVVSYHPQSEESTLKDILYAASDIKFNDKKVPSLVAVVDETDQWSHLHAVAAEDPHIFKLGYMQRETFSKMNDIRQGEYIHAFTENTGWIQIEKA